MITFKDVNKPPEPRRAKLAVFEHVVGSKVYDGLYDAYKLPNGSEAFYYYHAGGMVDETQVDLPNPPLRPDTLGLGLQPGLPMGVDMQMSVKPTGLDGWWVPLYKPPPWLCPLPSKHTLNVKDKKSLTVEAFANLDDSNIRFIVATSTKVRDMTQETKTEARVTTPRDPWKLSQSIFKARLKECESRAFFDSTKVLNRHFEREWEHMAEKEKFLNMACKENKNADNKLDDAAFVKSLKSAMRRHFPTICAVFNYYSAAGAGVPFQLQLNAFTQFLDDSNIPNANSESCKRSDCDTIFIVANYEQDKTTAKAKLNDDHGLMKFEMMEAIFRLAIAKHGKGVDTNDPIEALNMLFEMDVIPHLPAYALIDKNTFTQNRLYCEEVDDLYKKNERLLRAVYSRYRLPPRSGHVRHKMLTMEDWEKLSFDLGFVDLTFGIPDMRLCFVHSRMVVSDVVKQWDKYTQATFIDFLEALGYVADNKFLPSRASLEEAGFSNWFEWQLHVEQGGSESYNVIPRRASGTGGFGSEKTRPLAEKVEALLDMMFRRLYYDPSNPATLTDYSYDACITLMKKIDKSLGP